MGLTVYQDLATSTLRLEGTWLFEGRSEFIHATNEVLRKSKDEFITLDLSLLSYMDSSSLGMLLLLREKAEKSDRKVVLVDPTPSVRRILEIVQFDEWFEIKSGR